MADPQGAPLGLAQLRRDIPEPAQATAGQFFWQEYLARDATQALGFYKRVAGYESTISESRLGVEYHVLRKTRSCGGLFQIPPTADVRPNWLPYVLVDDPEHCPRALKPGWPYPGAGGTRAAEWFACRHRGSRRRPARTSKYPFELDHP